MLSMHIDNINDLAVVECQGRIVGSEAFRLREAVTSQTEARIVVLDLSEVYAIAGGGLGMLVYLQQWTRDQGIQFNLFNPSRSVRERLEHVGSIVSVRGSTRLTGLVVESADLPGALADQIKN